MLDRVIGYAIRASFFALLVVMMWAVLVSI